MAHTGVLGRPVEIHWPTKRGTHAPCRTPEVLTVHCRSFIPFHPLLCFTLIIFFFTLRGWKTAVIWRKDQNAENHRGIQNGLCWKKEVTTQDMLLPTWGSQSSKIQKQRTPQKCGLYRVFKSCKDKISNFSVCFGKSSLCRWLLFWTVLSTRGGFHY